MGVFEKFQLLLSPSLETPLPGCSPVPRQEASGAERVSGSKGLCCLRRHRQLSPPPPSLPSGCFYFYRHHHLPFHLQVNVFSRPIFKLQAQSSPKTEVALPGAVELAGFLPAFSEPGCGTLWSVPRRRVQSYTAVLYTQKLINETQEVSGVQLTNVTIIKTNE